MSDDDLPRDPYGVRVFDLEGERYVLDNAGEDPPTLYRMAGETVNPRTMAVHDGPVLLDGDVVRVSYDGTLFYATHHWKGTVERFTPEDIGETAVIRLERVSAL